ncbi:MAG: hypothetical protein AAFW70_30965, partial [Cyanobacteria bacterium J06635_10]
PKNPEPSSKVFSSKIVLRQITIDLLSSTTKANSNKGSGFFGNVRTWGLITNEDGEISFRPGIGKLSNKQRCANHRELIDPNGRRLILIVSDCVTLVMSGSGVKIAGMRIIMEYQLMAVLLS